jgi:hypothetical protein
MDRTGLLVKILDSEASIDKGRRLLDTSGFEREGRIDYRDGLALAMEAFQEVYLNAPDDLEALILAEYTFITQELQFCDPSDIQAIASLTQAIQSFDDALLSLKAVADINSYKVVDMTYPHRPKYRIKGMPKDAFHIACVAHRTRIGNILRAPGINLTEKQLLVQRSVNFTMAQTVYLEKQSAVFAVSQEQIE